jgi:hypothetical protein
MGLEGGADALRTSGRVEAELREQRPEAAPVAGEDAGLGGGGGVAELDKDLDKNAVGKRAEAVLAGRKPGRRGDLPVDVLHVHGGFDLGRLTFQFTPAKW